MFRVGQKVECVERGRFDEIWGGVTNCVIGGIYTVRWFGIEGGEGVLLVDEIVNPPCGDMGECGFYATRFRPIVSRKTSIEIFQRMLTPKQKELAR